MNERPPDETMKFGLLMESAQAHQKLAEVHLEKLHAHTRGLDDVVRDEIRRTLIEELRSVTVESERTTRALRDMNRAAQVRGVLWNVSVAVLCTAIPGAFAHWMLPSMAEIDALRQRRDSLAQSVVALERRGGKVDWRSCGEAARLCVRIDGKAQAYGEKSDYFIVKGY
jgi:hypothetical protein